jgi:hypothetical protein
MRLEFSFDPRNIKVSIVPMKTPTDFSTGNADVELTWAAARVSELGHSRRFELRPATSGLPLSTDVLGIGRKVSNGPNKRQGALDKLSSEQGQEFLSASFRQFRRIGQPNRALLQRMSNRHEA